MNLTLYTSTRSSLSRNTYLRRLFFRIGILAIVLGPLVATADEITVRNTSGSYQLSSGDTLVIPAGITFTGTVDGQKKKDAAIKVESGATWNQANLNSFKGSFINYGSATFNSFNFEANKQTFTNYGIATFGNINFNNHGDLQNKSGATVNINGSFSLPGNASLTNDGYLTINGDFNYDQSGGSGNEIEGKEDPAEILASGQFINNDWFQINGNYNNSGSGENQGLMAVTGDFTNKNGGKYYNYCNMEVTGNFICDNGSSFDNNGYTFIVGSGKTLTINIGGTYNAVEYSHTQGKNFTNNGTIKGDGDLRFSGYTINNSSASMGETGSDFRFFDTGFPSGGMDVNNGNTGSGVSFTYVPSYTSSDISQFCSNSFFASQVLPVEYAYFTGKMTTSGVELLWETIAEINNKEFVIERSVDGNLYESIDVISEQEGQQRSSLGGRKYTYMDKQATLFNSATIYYRLKQVDIDGAFTVSSILEVSIEDSDSQYWGRTYPNPASDKFTLETVVPVNYELISPQGQRVKAGIAKAGERNTIDISTLTPGVYILRIEENMQINYRRILIL